MDKLFGALNRTHLKCKYHRLRYSNASQVEDKLYLFHGSQRKELGPMHGSLRKADVSPI